MAGQTTSRRAVVAGAVLCGCLLVLLATTPVAAIVPQDGDLGDTGSAGASGTGAAPAGEGGRAVAAAAGGDTRNCDGDSARAATVPDGTHTAVLDRIEADLAVLEVIDDENSTHELVVDVDDLPTDGRHPNAVFEIRVTDGELRNATYDESRSEARLEEAQDRFDGLAAGAQDEAETEDAQEE